MLKAYQFNEINYVQLLENSTLFLRIVIEFECKDINSLFKGF